MLAPSQKIKENFTRKPMGIAAKFYYARSWLILPGMVKNHDSVFNQSDCKILEMRYIINNGILFYDTMIVYNVTMIIHLCVPLFEMIIIFIFIIEIGILIFLLL